MEAVPDTERKEDKTEAQSPVKAEWPSETPVLCQQCGGKPGVTFTSAKGEVFSVLEFAPCESAQMAVVLPHPPQFSYFCTRRPHPALRDSTWVPSPSRVSQAAAVQAILQGSVGLSGADGLRVRDCCLSLQQTTLSRRLSSSLQKPRSSSAQCERRWLCWLPHCPMASWSRHSRTEWQVGCWELGEAR